MLNSLMKKLREVEQKLDQAAGHIHQLTSIVESLRAEIAKLKSRESQTPSKPRPSLGSNEGSADEFIERITGPGQERRVIEKLSLLSV
jgi:chromosome segregation ATPase